MTSLAGYANSVDLYWDLGWRGLIPLAAGTKWPPPIGFTGHGGADPSYPDVCEWKDSCPDGNLGLRLGEDQIGIDVDCYDGKPGAATLAEAEKLWGKLPPSVTSSSRDDGSGIRLYRIPSGVQLRDRIKFGEGTGGIEVIQRHHRYVVCWPSFHPDSGEQYTWRNGKVMDAPPSPEDLPELPQAWIEGLRVEPASATDASEIPADVLEFVTEGNMSARVANELASAVGDLGTSRHDSTRAHVLTLLRFGKIGEPGTLHALTALREAFIKMVGPDRKGGKKEARAEFNRFITNPRAARLLAEPNKTKVKASSKSAVDCESRSAVPQQDSKPGEGTYTDSGNAANLVRECRNRFRYVEESGQWIGWDSMRWQPLADAGRIEHEARTLAARIPVPEPVTAGSSSKLTEAEKDDDKAHKAAIAFKLKSLSQQGITGAVRVARTDPDFHISQALLDTNGQELNTLSGIVDLRTGNLLPHSKESWHTKITGVGYDQAGAHPEWDAFLNTTFQGDEELIKFIQRIAGYACIGEVTHHVLPFLFGAEGQNGKSVLLTVFQAA